MLQLRSSEYPQDLGIVAAVLGGGIPREVVRIGELVTSNAVARLAPADAVAAALCVEVGAFVEEALSASAGTDLSDRDKLARYGTVATWNLRAPKRRDLTGR